MLPFDSALAAVARELDAPVPLPGNDGERVFDLKDSLRLGILTLPDRSALVAWSVVSDPGPGESSDDAESRAAAFLRAHLGRLRRCGAVTATLDAGGAGILYVRSAPDTEAEWLRDVAGLLDETETVRNILSANAEGRASVGTTERASLFSGMAGLLRER